MNKLGLSLDRNIPTALSGQIVAALDGAIAHGRLQPGDRLPSVRDLASQLGVARGTVQAAYLALVDARRLVALGAAGTRVARSGPPEAPGGPALAPLRDPIADYPRASGVFQMGVPARDAFPAGLWSRLHGRAARASVDVPQGYPDPRGEPVLRCAIASYLAVARGVACGPEQVFVTSGHAAGVGMAVQALGLAGRAWCEDPGYPPTRKLLAALGLDCVPVPVDALGLDVAQGAERWPDARLALVTPGQQAPLGVVMAPARRRALLDRAVATGGWVIEDDYLGELQLQGRAAPSLAALAGGQRVLHVGTFSKTISPTLRLGFLVVPRQEVRRFDEMAECFGSAPAAPVQNAVAEFMAGGHLLRHLRRTKRLYLSRREALLACLRSAGVEHRAAGLSVLVGLPAGLSDVELTRQARQHGMAPVPLSPWYFGDGPARAGLLLGITDLPEVDAAPQYARLAALIGS